MDFASFVLAAATADLSEASAARAHADALEFRMDGADEPLEALRAYKGELPVIATNRPAWAGGGAATGTDRLEVLETAARMQDVGAIDVELETVERGDAASLLGVARETDTSVIVSTHDFDRTPDAETCRSLLARAGDRGDVAKLAVTATAPGDVLTLLQVTLDATRSGETVATMAMGDAGRHSRAIAPIYGSRIGYAPVDASRATAPGQFDLATLRSLIECLTGSVSANSAIDQ